MISKWAGTHPLLYYVVKAKFALKFSAYNVLGKDALGRTFRRRGFSDNNLYVAYNTQPKVTEAKVSYYHSYIFDGKLFLNIYLAHTFKEVI